MRTMPTDTRKRILHRARLRTQWALALLCVAGNSFGGSILFIGNSFTFAFGSPVQYYRADTVTDLNSAGQGGVPALFKSFTVQAGLNYDVYLETEPGVGIDGAGPHGGGAGRSREPRSASRG